MSRLTETGDTIVEVLMALSVTSFLLVIAYVMTNASLKGNIASHQRSAALQLAETQAEALRTLTSPSPVSSTLPDFCIASGSTTATTNSAPPSNFLTDNFMSYVPACRQPDGFVDITHPGDPNSFIITVRWASASGGNDQLSLDYTVY
jgi:competence protein ComGC